MHHNSLGIFSLFSCRFFWKKTKNISFDPFYNKNCKLILVKPLECLEKQGRNNMKKISRVGHDYSALQVQSYWPLVRLSVRGAGGSKILKISLFEHIWKPYSWETFLQNEKILNWCRDPRHGLPDLNCALAYSGEILKMTFRSYLVMVGKG